MAKEMHEPSKTMHQKYIAEEASSDPYVLNGTQVTEPQQKTSAAEPFSAVLERHNDAGSFTAEQLLLYINLSTQEQGSGECLGSPKTIISAAKKPNEVDNVSAEDSYIVQNLLGPTSIPCPFAVGKGICCERKRARKKHQVFHIDELRFLGKSIITFGSVLPNTQWFVDFLVANKQKFHKCRNGKDLYDKARKLTKWWPLSESDSTISDPEQKSIGAESCGTQEDVGAAKYVGKLVGVDILKQCRMGSSKADNDGLTYEDMKSQTNDQGAICCIEERVKRVEEMIGVQHQQCNTSSSQEDSSAGDNGFKGCCKFNASEQDTIKCIEARLKRIEEIINLACTTQQDNLRSIAALSSTKCTQPSHDHGAIQPSLMASKVPGGASKIPVAVNLGLSGSGKECSSKHNINFGMRYKDIVGLLFAILFEL